MTLNSNIEKIDSWLSQEGLDSEIREELADLKKRFEENPRDAELADEINDRFYRELEFGTAGIRGILGAGPNRISVHTIRKISQGFANKILEDARAKGIAEPSIVIAYDNRKNSDLFSFESALVFSANGIKTFLFDMLSATPLLSFSVPYLKADAGVVVTASHNAKIYNGYKIYDNTGCQCMPDEASRVANHIDALDLWTDIRTTAGKYTGTLAERKLLAEKEEPLLHIIGEEIQDVYLEKVLAESKTPGALADISIVYTPLHGAGNVPVRKVLKDAGIKRLDVVKEQELPDPEFTTCPEPNPEKLETLKLALLLCEKLKNEGAAPDLLIGTDPDSDRVGACIFHEGDYVRLSGNQVGVLILDYVISARERDGTLDCRATLAMTPLFVTTIVSTPITEKMAEKHGIETMKVLTGFKNIGNVMNAIDKEGGLDRYVFGFEESCGYLTGTYARDKDAVDASLILCEIAGVLKRDGKTAIDRLEEIYEEYGYYLDGLSEFIRPGEKGMHEISAIMKSLRGEEIKSVFSSEIVKITDYLNDEVYTSDVMEFDLADGSKVLARPSGTEPKLKIYYTGVGKTEKDAKNSIERMKSEMKNFIG
ncbi:MAG: phospho-sugar mutase [Clostridiales Family XIII bacterium]|jgi:phosphoglucomutase|nr:phospho-sugar mutase [Clostridiales Family XIII bacterium]